MKITDIYGNKVLCVICGCEHIHDYRKHDDIYFAWCIEHKGQGLQNYRNYMFRINE
jgi:hypothetical protein